MTIQVLGGDPGRSAGLAIVRMDAAGFKVLWTANVYGSAKESKRTSVKQDVAWGKRLDVAAAEVEVDYAPGSPCGISAVYIEEPAGRGASKKKLGPDTWLRMGQFQGRLLEAFRWPALEPQRITTTSWASVCNTLAGPLMAVQSGKKSDRWGHEPHGWHRCREAAHLTDWKLPVVPESFRRSRGKSKTEAERLVAIAEAVLIAVAGCCLESRA